MYYREELFDSLKSNESTVHLLDGSSCEIKDNGTVNLQTHDEAMKKLDEVRYISSFRLISLSRLNSSGYR